MHTIQILNAHTSMRSMHVTIMLAAKQTKTAGAEAVHHIEWLLEAATMYIQSPQYYAYTLDAE